MVQGRLAVSPEAATEEVERVEMEVEDMEVEVAATRFWW